MIAPELRLEKMIESDKVPHLLIFHGPKESKKEELARTFAFKLLKEKHALGYHRDLHELVPEGKTGMHAIVSIRALLAKASMKPAGGSYQIFMIHDADHMLASSANALLKTLEEPHPFSIFILLVAKPERLLSTIVSRAQKVPFPASLSHKRSELQNQIVEWLKSGVYLDEIESMTKAWDSKKKEKEKKALAALTADLTPTEKEHATKEIEGALSIAHQEEFFSLLEMVALWQRDLNCLRLGVKEKLHFAEFLSDLEKMQDRAKPYLEVERALNLARTAYHRHMPLQAIIESLFIKLTLA